MPAIATRGATQALLVAQHDHRIDASCEAGRDVTCRQRDGDQNSNDGG
jgi:hypothetical protein